MRSISRYSLITLSCPKIIAGRKGDSSTHWYGRITNCWEDISENLSSLILKNIFDIFYNCGLLSLGLSLSPLNYTLPVYYIFNMENSHNTWVECRPCKYRNIPVQVLGILLKRSWILKRQSNFSKLQLRYMYIQLLLIFSGFYLSMGTGTDLWVHFLACSSPLHK